MTCRIPLRSSLAGGVALASLLPALAAAQVARSAQRPDARRAAADSAATHPEGIQHGDPLLDGFREPGDAARPRVWWHWMNGNVTWDGARRDMDWMKRVGIGGLQAFDAGRTTPQVVEKRLPYMSAGWKDVFARTAAYADRLGLELGIAASPGWSETGGPWVKPEDAMKKMVWSATRVHGGSPFDGVLPRPPTTTGVFQTSTEGGVLGGRRPGQNPPEYYTDAKVVAFRVPAATALPTPAVTASGGALDAAALSDGDLEKPAIELPAAADVGGESWIRFDYGRPVVVRGVTLSTPFAATYYDALSPETRAGIPPLAFRLDASDDGVRWRDTGARLATGRPQRTAAVPSVRARYFRFVSVRQPAAAERRRMRFMRPQSPVPEAVPIRELALRGENTVASFEEKAGFYNNTAYYQLPGGTADPAAIVPPDDVADLTGRMQADGRLAWTPPAGDWIVMRIGSSLTGSMNSPASPEATGLEVDKLDPGAARRYIDTYLAMYRDASGGLIGKRGLHAMMFDSWEASNSNWTPKIVEEFQRLRGYDPTPWLPTLAGYEIGVRGQSDQFLWDWRRTIQQLLKANHYEQLTGILHDVGMIRYGEGHEELFVTVGDGMEMKQSADVPMGAMWQVDKPGDIEPVYFNDLQETASVAHIYGQNLAAAEALTGGPRFGSAPWDLKPTADAVMLAGANRFVIHTSTHQPISRGPGLTLGVGQYFTRNETWAEQAKPWVRYLTRASFLLQQGRGTSDVAVFYGEAAPVIAAYRETFPAVPDGYRYDYVNADAILNRLSMDDGVMATPTGMRYRVLFFGNGTERVSLPVLRKVRDMVRDGAILVGLRPQGSPSLADGPDEVKTILDELWPGVAVASVGRGRVFATADTAGPLAESGIEPDFSYVKPHLDSHVMFIHRRLEEGDAYFLSNRIDRAETIEASFRVAGRRPALWDPATGEKAPTPYRIVAGRTQVAVPLDRFGSVFVVFRGPAQPAGETPPARVETVLARLEGPWAVAFQPGRGAPPTAQLAELSDLSRNDDPGIRYFSGIATYGKEVDVPESWKRAGGKIWLDLGDVRDLAEVSVDGALVGAAWKPPYRVEIGAALHTGKNRIDVKAVNLWVNRLIGDVQPGVSRKISFTLADGTMAPAPATAESDGMAPPGAPTARERALAMPYKPDAPLRPSGLLGPVTLVRSTP